MRVDASQVLAQGGVKTKQGTEALLDSLKEGSSGVGAGGAEESSEDDLSLGKPHLLRGFTDRSLAPFAEKLAELHMPVKEETARAMRDIMAQNPKLSMDEAAFLASNKITGDESLMRAALSVLSGGDKTHAMIAQILATLGSAVEGLEAKVAGEKPTSGDDILRLAQNDKGEGTQTSSKLPDSFSVSASGRAPLSELIAAVVKLAPGLLAAGSEGTPAQPAQAPGEITQPIISQPNDNLQLNAEKLVENLQKPVSDGVPGELGVRSEELGVKVAGEQSPPAQGDSKPVQNAGAQVQAAAGDGKPVQNVGVQAQAVGESKTGEVAGQARNDGAQGEAKTVQNAVAQLLSEVPEFKGTPQSALDRFSNMLLRIAQDTDASNAGAAKDVELLASQLEKMFTKIDRSDADAGTRLRQAREELFARLTLVQEEIARASQPMREQLLSQTQKLMDHVKLLNNIEQFAYMQLPVQLTEERSTAELYIFKRKGGKRADPDNVNILLSIDLEFMGHWEALLNIKGKDVVLDMEVAGEAEKEHFGENTVLLHELLSEDGFKLVNTTIKISKEETTPLNALSAFDRYTGGRQGKIDFVI